MRAIKRKEETAYLDLGKGEWMANRVGMIRTTRVLMKQEDLAKRVGVTRQTILLIEDGRLNPSVRVALIIARILGEPVDYLFYIPKEDEINEFINARGG